MTQKPSIFPLPNGPYIYKDPASMKPCGNLESAKGKPIANQPYVALCRCGGSKSKPFCDGTHISNGFRSDKAPDRTPDKRNDYAGKEVVVHDNRGVCSHAGYCTERLAAVFREDDEPWIDPNGAKARQIIDAVKRCPSGALSYSVKAVAHLDQERAPRVTVSKDGPYCLEGGIEMPGVEFGAGASREHYCLCRCGRSKNKPFCDGTHWEVKFNDAQ